MAKDNPESFSGSPLGHPSVAISQDVSLLLATFLLSFLPSHLVKKCTNAYENAIQALLLQFGIKKHLLF